MEKQRLLVVVRHAKAQQFAASDIERVLTPRGRADAVALGEWLAASGVRPDVAYVSAAARTRETWQCLAEGAGWGLEPQIEGQLYGTDEDGVLELVHGTPDEAGTVIVVGHNPTMAMLVQLLDDGAGAATGAAELGTFPTSTAAVFATEGAWDEVAAMGCRMELFEVARS